MAEPFSNPVSKLSRAIVAYLISTGCGSAQDIFPMYSKADREFPNITVEQGSTFVPEPPMSGNYRGLINIRIKGSAAQNAKDPNPSTPEVQFAALVASTYDAMMQSDDDQTLRATVRSINAAGRALAVDASGGANPVQVRRAADNADMVDFTLLELYDAGIGVGTAEDEGCDWEQVFQFDCSCCSKNVD